MLDDTTDPRVEAACEAGYAVVYRGSHNAAPSFGDANPRVQDMWREFMRAALEAADRAAWCFDITAAPGMTFLSLAIECNGERFLYHDAARTEDGSWLDSDGDPIDEDLIVAWRLPPALPEVSKP